TRACSGLSSQRKRLPLLDQSFRLLGDDADHAGVGVRAVHGGSGTVDDLDALNVAQRILAGEIDGVVAQVALLDAVDKEDEPVIVDRDISALVDPRVRAAVPAGNVKARQVMEKLFEEIG